MAYVHSADNRRRHIPQGRHHMYMSHRFVLIHVLVFWYTHCLECVALVEVWRTRGAIYTVRALVQVHGERDGCSSLWRVIDNANVKSTTPS